MKNKWDYPDKVNTFRFTKLHQQKVLNHLNTSSLKKGHKKTLYSGLTVATMLIILLGSALFIPSLENVVAKIPYISSFLEEKELTKEKQEDLRYKVLSIVEEKGLEISSVGINLEKKEMIVEVKGSSEDVRNISNQIENQLEGIELSGFDIILLPLEEEIKVQAERSKAEIDKDEKESTELTTALTKRLQAEGYELMYPIQVRINNIEEGIYMNVIVPESEYRLENLSEIMKEEANHYGDEYKIDIRQVQKKAREQEKRWNKTDAISNIGDALMDAKQFSVTGYGFSFHPYPLQIIIKTSLNTDNPDASEIAGEIRSEIDSYIESSEETKTIQNDQYKVIVRSKDQNEIQ